MGTGRQARYKVSSHTFSGTRELITRRISRSRRRRTEEQVGMRRHGWGEEGRTIKQENR
jgi:hypothetical protein